MSNQLVIIRGQPGTGKTKIAQHLFRMSSIYQNTFNSTPTDQTHDSKTSVLDSPQTQPNPVSNSSSSFDAHLNNSSMSASSVSFSKGLNIQVKYLASNLAAVHVCLRADRRTREPGQFLHNLVWSLAQFDCLNKIVSCPENTVDSDR